MILKIKVQSIVKLKVKKILQPRHYLSEGVKSLKRESIEILDITYW